MRFEGPYAAAIATAVLCAAMLYCSPYRVHAQTFGALPVAEQPAANTISNVDVSGVVAAQIYEALKKGHDVGKLWQAATCEGLKFGIGNGAVEILKHVVHEARPNRIGPPVSFPSGHTWNAFTGNAYAGGWSYSWSMSVGILRVLAAEHRYWPDVIVGAVGGIGTNFGVNQIPFCKGVS